MRKRALVAAALALLASLSTARASGRELDSATGLLIAPGFEAVKANCTVCHSAKLVAQMRGDRHDWKALIQWMQQTQNLWALPPPTESAILDYLSTYYAPSRARSRRAPLAARFLPPQAP